MQPTEGDVSYACVSLLVDEFARAGLVDACVAPGSRSTPLVLAIERHPAIDLHVHLDERSAAFFALGLAKAIGRPAAIACTSGTAAANCLPAIVEACHARVPLLVLTADRPPELRATGANQTIDQVKMFGDFVRMFVEAGTPEARPGAARYWRSLGARCVAAALGLPAGPVHVNLPFREPLVPTGAAVELGPETGGRAGGAPWERVAAPVLAPSESDVADLAALISSTERGVIVAGVLDEDPVSVEELAAAAGWPLIAEPASGLRLPGALAAASHLLADEDFAASHRPDTVLQFGAAPTGRQTLTFLGAARDLIVVDPKGLSPDPARHATTTIRCDAEKLAGAVLDRLGTPRRSAWLEEWQEIDARCRGVIDDVLDSFEQPFEGRVARDLYALLDSSATLVVASSMPVRDLEAFAKPREGVRVMQNRGASGIDGFVSTVLGVAATGTPTCALTGDLSLLHDVGALLWGARRAHGVVMVVVNNDGGGLFDFLPQKAIPEHERLFVTPHGLDLAAIARAAGAAHERVETPSAFSATVVGALGAEGVTIVEVPIDRTKARAYRKAVHAAVRDAIEARVRDRGSVLS
jgi:2-succinyl-5-enolpyruvyl-6-hydroxy-3-cyclohexene-1-carboxylate synthase